MEDQVAKEDIKSFIESMKDFRSEFSLQVTKLKNEMSETKSELMTLKKILKSKYN